MTNWADTFAGRTVGSGSWGTASDGETWAQLSGAGAGLSVSGGQGLYTSTGQIMIMKLGSNTGTDMESWVRWSFGAASDNVHTDLRLADVTHFYRLGMVGLSTIQLGKKNGGGFTSIATATSPITFTTSTLYWWHFKVIGPNLFGRVWADGSSEPGIWHITASDTSITSGSVGVACNTGAGATTITFDSFTANTIAPSMGAQSARREDFIRGRY
jgi:pectate lyase